MAIWSVEPRHIIGARHITTHYDVRCDGQPFGRLPAGDDLRALLRSLLEALPEQERAAIVQSMAVGTKGAP